MCGLTICATPPILVWEVKEMFEWDWSIWEAFLRLLFASCSSNTAQNKYEWTSLALQSFGMHNFYTQYSFWDTCMHDGEEIEGRRWTQSKCSSFVFSTLLKVNRTYKANLAIECNTDIIIYIYWIYNIYNTEYWLQSTLKRKVCCGIPTHVPPHLWELTLNC